MAAKRATRLSIAIGFAGMLIAASCSAGTAENQPAQPTVTPAPTATEVAAVEPTASSETAGGILPLPPVAGTPPVSDEAVAAALDVAPMPLGTIVVAKPGGGIPFVHPPLSTSRALLEIPVYDEPFGESRVLVDAEGMRYPLLQLDAGGPPIVLRVLAGGPEDEWIQVQAPGLAHDASVWVQSLYFDFDFTITRIEADLADGGDVRLINGGAIMAHARLISRGPASASLHRVAVVGGAWTFPSLGSALMRPEGRELIIGAVPGTPVIVFDSSDPEGGRETVANRSLPPATTVSFADDELQVGPAAFPRDTGEWEHCAGSPSNTDSELICSLAVIAPAKTLVPLGNVFLTAKPDAGQVLVNVGDVVPVYDEPGGPKRLLVDYNAIEGVELAYPTYHPTLFGQPLVLRVLQGAPGDEFVLVQAPIRPHRQSVWVRVADFDWGQTLTRIEIDLGNDGQVTVFERDAEVISSRAAYGRESRPTVLHDTYVEQAFEGRTLSPAYGSYILTLASYSEVLGTYGATANMPGQSLHGTNQPELIGQRVSSGGVRVPNEVIDEIYALPDIVGAGVIIFDSAGIGREAAIRLQRSPTWFPARTTTFPQTTLGFVGAHSYS